jgi:soluble lytic murein transglycosylase-like protein
VSVDAVVARVSELEQMLALRGPVPASTAPVSNFAAQLSSAGTGATATPAGSPLATAASTAAGSGPSSLPAGTPYAAEITAAANRNGVDPALLAGLVKQESGFNPNAGSPAGAQGLTQLMPATAASLGGDNVHDPAQALEGGAKYLRRQLDRFGGDVARALAAYNAGPGAVERFGGVPPYAETQNYVRKVQAFAAEFRTAAPAPPTTAVATYAPAAGAVSTSPSVHGIV